MAASTSTATGKVDWIRRLELQVDDKSIRRGNGYYRAHAVRITSGSPERVDSAVQGSSLYTVTIRVEGPDILAACICPFFDTGNICKHIWATLLAAHEQGYLAKIAGITDPYIDVDISVDDLLDELDDEDDEEAAPAPPKPEPWRQDLISLRSTISAPLPAMAEGRRKVLYLVDVMECATSRTLAIRAGVQRLKKNGEWSKPAFHENWIRDLHDLDAADQRILALLGGGHDACNYGYGMPGASTQYQIQRASSSVLIPMLCESGRFFLRPSGAKPDERTCLEWRAEPWSVKVEMQPDVDAQCYRLTGCLESAQGRIPLKEPVLLTAGLVFFANHVSPFDDKGAFEWAAFFRRTETLTVPFASRQDFMAEVARFPDAPPLEFPPEFEIESRPLNRPPFLKIRQGKPAWNSPGKLECEVGFDYGSQTVSESEPGFALFDAESGRLFRRDRNAERVAIEKLSALGVQRNGGYDGPHREIAPARLPSLVGTLVSVGWRVEAEGRLYRSSSSFNMQVRSGIDWFELDGEAVFEDQTVPMPEILKAIARGQNAITLGDGSVGVLPQTWLEKYKLVAGFGHEHDGSLRFGRHQAGLLDALLASEPGVTFDAAFIRVRNELESFSGIEAAAAPGTFAGELRQYQREGLGWLQFIRRFGFGGCLADDMGLGKTIQVLALLDSDARRGPALVVVPRSLVFNWKQEAVKFAPGLRVLDQTTSDRKTRWNGIAEYDIILATYGTLRRDILTLKDIRFDTVILDEAQTIKNASTESSKAVRLLKSDHRLVMTGTPIENRLTDLWSLFEFLNPGMLGSVSVFRSNMAANGNAEAEQTAVEASKPVQLLARALRPFILRRTKEQVAAELPTKTEQTIYCELEGEQRKTYDKLRNHYRKALLGQVAEMGIQKSRMHILEALLRLRQAACHPGLLDKSRVGESSAKLDALLPQLSEILEEGHKALVFSQFTSLLAILKKKLDAEKITYEYLDGKTRDRDARVRRFQEDPACPLFLISLKAGGLGLNLTAAEYVFLLDPWWNPAVEAQAVDRSHRIGQLNRVFAYRLIARNTVEEKVLELQQSKRNLADAIITEDNSVLAGLTRENLELLLS